MAVVELLEPRKMMSSAPPPAVWANRGPGAGGALFDPSISPYNSSEIYTVTDMSEVYHTTNMGQSWSFAPFTQLTGSRATHVEFTSDPNIRYTIDYNDQLGVFPARSTDGGATWKMLTTTPGNSFYGVWADPSTTTKFLTNDYNSLYISTDSGATYTKVYTSPSGGCWVAGVFYDGSNIYVGTNNGMLVSTDGGSTFAMSTATGLPAGTGIVSLAGAKQNGVTRIYCVLDKIGDVYNGLLYESIPTSSFSGVYSLDAGQTSWTNRSAGIPSGEAPVFVSLARNNINTVYLGGTTGSVPIVLKSTTAGAAWSDVLTTANNGNVATGWQGAGGDRDWSYAQFVEGFEVAPSDPNVVAFTDLGFIHISSNGGTSWQQAYVNPAGQNPAGSPTPKHKAYQSVGIEDTSSHWITWADASDVVAGYTDIYGARSTDGGQSWSFPSNISLAGNSIYQISSVTTNSVPSGVILYAATSTTHDIYESTHVVDSTLGGGGKIIYSADKGATWSLLHDFGHPVVYTATDPTNPNRLYASVVSTTAGGIYVTNDLQDGAASTWTKLANPPRTVGHAYNIQVLKDGSIVVTYSAQQLLVNGVYQFTATAGVFYSTDGGQTWQDRTLIGTKGNPSMQYWTKDVTIDPNDPTQSTWYVAVRSGYGGDGSANATGGLYRTTDKGLTWTRVFNKDSESCAFNPATGDLYVATLDNGLWYCGNPKAANPTFTQTTYAFRQPSRIFFDPYDPSQVWVTAFGDGLTVGTIPFANNTGASINVDSALAGGAMAISTSGGNTTFTSPDGSYSFPTTSFSSIVIGDTSGSDSLTVNAGPAVTFDSSQSLASLSVNGGTVALSPGGNSTLVVKSLAFSNSGTLDLADNAMIVDYTGTSPMASIRADLASGFNTGAWNGAGIDSSSAAADSSMSHALGYAEASDLGVNSFMGDPVDATAILIRYTKYGDNNLDGTIDIGNDFAMLLDGLAATNASSWVQGDYTFDGKVDLGNDANLFIRNYLNSLPNSPSHAALGAPAIAEPAPAISAAPGTIALSLDAPALFPTPSDLFQ
jgi:hypothetical protein